MLLKLSPDGPTLLNSSYIGGGVGGAINGIAIDASGSVYLAGIGDQNLSTVNAFQSSSPATAAPFMLKLANDMKQVMFATYLSGSGGGEPFSIATDVAGNVYLSGRADSGDFPAKAPLQEFKGGGFYNSDCFLAKFVPSGQALIYSTLLGGSNLENGCWIGLDNNSNAYLIGFTASTDFPVKNANQPTFGGQFDGFLARLSDISVPVVSPLVPSTTLLRFNSNQNGSPPAAQVVTGADGAFTVGTSVSWLLATASGSTVAVSVNPAGLLPGTYNGTLTLSPPERPPAQIDINLTVESATPLLSSVDPYLIAIGTDDQTITLHGTGFSRTSALLVDGISWTITPLHFVDGETVQFSMPATYFSVQYNHSIAVQNPQSALSNVLSLSVGVLAPSFTAASVVNAGSFAGGAVAPGEIVTIFGTNLVGNVTFDNIPATIVYSSATQISATVPYTVLGLKTLLQIGSSVPVSLDVAASAPGIFAVVANGNGTLTLYATGCGQITQDPLPLCQLPVSAIVNGEPVQVLYAGVAPGLVQGANQVNLTLPTDIASGRLISIVLTAGTTSTKPLTYTLP